MIKNKQATQMYTHIDNFTSACYIDCDTIFFLTDKCNFKGFNYLLKVEFQEKII